MRGRAGARLIGNETIDIRVLNDEAPWRSATTFYRSGAAVLVVIGTFLTYAWTSAVQGHPLGPRLPATFDATLAALFLGSGALALLVVRTPALAQRMEVSPEGMALYYRTGRVRTFRWADPKLDLRLFDRVIPSDRPTAGRRISLWGPGSDPTSIPIEVFDRLLAYLPTVGVYITQYPGVAPGSIKYRFTRSPPSEAL